MRRTKHDAAAIAWTLVIWLNFGFPSVKAFACLIFGYLFLAANGAASIIPLERSVSSSRQFIVYGTTTPLRGAVAEVAEKTKANLLNVIQQRDNWRIPIILNLQFPQANEPDIPPAQLRFSQTGAGLKIQLDLTIASDFDALVLRRQLLRVVILEMMYRRSSDLPAGSVYVEPPDWLVEGVLAADPSRDRTPIVNAVNPLVSQNRVASLEEFLGRHFSFLDSPGQLVYRGYALAFVQLLLNEPGGPDRLTTYITNLSQSSSDQMSDLKAQFPVLAAGADSDALWKSSVANLGAMNYGLFTAAESERQLDDLLTNYGEKLTKLARSKPNKSKLAELRPLKEQLILLDARANPMVRPLVFEYEQIVAKITARKIKGLSAQFARAELRRKELRTRAGDIDDYMNWFEVTKSGEDSGAFTGYLRAAARAHEPQPRRRDPLSVYLDSLEAQF